MLVAFMRRIWHRWMPRWSRRRRIPIVYQLDVVECGTACLAMILAHLGHARPLVAARSVCDPGRDGLTLDEIVAGARALHLETQVHPAHRFEELASFPLPAIAHWRRNHFVVIERLGRDDVVVLDPARGRLNVSASEFNLSAGALVTCARAPAFEPSVAGSSTQVLRFLAGLVRAAGANRTLLVLAGYSFALQIVGLVTPLLTQLLIDHVIPGRRTAPLSWLGFAIIAIVCSQVMLRYVRAEALTRLQARLDTTLMTRFVSHLLDLPLRFFQRRSAGDLLMRLAANSHVRDLITGQSLAVIFDGLFVIGYLGLLLIWSPLLAGIALALGLLQALVLLTTRTALKDVTDRQVAAQADTHGTLVEALHGITSLKALGAEPFVVARWSELFRRQLDLSTRRQLLGGLFESVLTGLRLLSTLLFLWYGAREVLLGHMTLGTMLGLNALAAGFLLPIGSLVGNLQQFHLLRTQLARILDVLDAEPEQPARRGLTRRISGAIVFDKVAFRYQASGPLVLSDVSFEVRPRQCVAIVGPTGSGKSTLAALLLGLYQPTSGTVRFDGVPLTGFDYRALRRQCGVVFQDSLVFAGSLRDNIAFGHPDIQLPAIVRAAMLAEIHDEIGRMPMGYDTPLLDGGSGLSAGQRQRLLLARAFVHEPTVLVLDEATSHLDAKAERRIMRTIMALPCTRLLITHRLASLRHADLVVVLDGGRVIETGTPADLFRRDGLYASWGDAGANAFGDVQACQHAIRCPVRGLAITDRGG
jgi:ATP-binding cassette subfamily B protein